MQSNNVYRSHIFKSIGQCEQNFFCKSLQLGCGEKEQDSQTEVRDIF